VGWGRHEAGSLLQPVALGEHGAEGLDLHLAEAGQSFDVGPKLVAVPRILPDPACVVAILIADVGREFVYALSHFRREAMDGRFLLEHRHKVRSCELCRIERPDALKDRQRTRESLRHRDLLIQGETDQQRHRVAGDQFVGLVGVGEVQVLRHHTSLTRVPPRGGRPCALRGQLTAG
jgi:hypothetical protein